MKLSYGFILLVFLHIFMGNLLAEPATKDDIKLILEQMDKRFEQADKRFEQIDKRFEQVDKRFDLLMLIIALWIPIAFGIVLYILQRIYKNEDRIFSLSRSGISEDTAPYILVKIFEHTNQSQRKRIKEILKV